MRATDHDSFQVGEVMLSTMELLDCRENNDDPSVVFDANLLVSPASEYLYCDICFNIMQRPLQCPSCGNSFCAMCIHQALSTIKESCPACCQPLSKTQLIVNRALSGTINDLIIKCPSTANGDLKSNAKQCDWNGTIKNALSHLKVCKFKSESDCDKKIKGYSGINKHIEKDDCNANLGNMVPQQTAVKLHVVMDILMEICPYGILDLSIAYLGKIVDKMVEIPISVEEDKPIYISDIPIFVALFEEFLNYIYHLSTTRVNSSDCFSVEYISQWKEFVDTVLSVDIRCIHDLAQHLIEVCANLSDVLEANNLQSSHINSESVKVSKISKNFSSNMPSDIIRVECKPFCDSVGSEKCILIELGAEDSNIGADDKQSTISLTIRELSDHVQLSVKDTIFLLLKIDSTMASKLGLSELQRQLHRNSLNDESHLSEECIVEISSHALEMLYWEAQQNLISLREIAESKQLEIDMSFLCSFLRSQKVYVVDWKSESYILQSDYDEVSNMLDKKDEIENCKKIEKANHYLSSSNRRKQVFDEVFNQEDNEIALADIRSFVMTLRDLGSMLGLSVDHLGFILSRMDSHMTESLGLLTLQAQMKECIDNHKMHLAANCLLELSNDDIEKLKCHLESILISLSAFFDGKLDGTADITALSDCLRAGGKCVIDWKEDMYVLKSDGQDICSMLGLKMQADSHCEDEEHLVKHCNGVVKNHSGENVDEVKRCVYSPPPEVQTLYQGYISFDNIQGSDLDLSEFPPDSPALSQTTSAEVQEMIQSGFSSSCDNHAYLSPYMSLHDLSFQWRISVDDLIYLAERRLVPVDSPASEEVEYHNRRITGDWLVQSDQLCEISNSAQQKLVNILHFADMFEGIQDISLVLSGAQLHVITWDKEKYILETETETAMEICMNINS